MKEKFLKDLEKKLSVLSDEEIKDIINEYSDIIDEKIKHGKTEEEAIKEFGDVKELSKEILKAYKINPDYSRSEFSDKTNDFIKNSEDLIKKGAQKLSDVTEDVVDGFKSSGKEFDTANVFEIIIKVIIVLVGLALLRIPFYIIGGFGQGIFSFGSFPFDNVFTVLWRIFIGVAYILVCALLITAVVNKYAKSNSNNSRNENKRSSDKIVESKTTTKKDNTNESKKNVKDENISESRDTRRVVSRKDDTFGNFLVILIKIWCVILILVPLWCMEIGLLMAICVAIYLIVKGIAIYGILLLLIGIFGMIGYFTDIVWKLLFEKGKLHIFPLFINVALIVVGGLLTFDYFTTIDYVNKLPNEYKEVNNTYMVTIDEETYIDDTIDKYIDNTLLDNQLRFEVTYYNDVYQISEPVVVEESGSDRIETIKRYRNQHYGLNNKYFKEGIEHLKDKEIYNYSLIDHINIKVYSNEKTSELFN